MRVGEGEALGQCSYSRPMTMAAVARWRTEPQQTNTEMSYSATELSARVGMMLSSIGQST
jgi:hypothetical protein